MVEKEQVEAPQAGEAPQVYNTLKAFEKKYGTKNFLEVSLKETEGKKFFNIAKGYYDKFGNRRFKVSVGFEAVEDLKKFVTESLEKL